ncbi:DNA-binding protein [Rhizobium sp. BE258]|uniref:helix-turn-helix transcriptional regulator n=1 Tax=Rhizobium sp. BE258 TaxID=2817722 RepID=UPI002859390E|nr:DNA-binding protein [Rhizobium sp. BE258]MDR7147069.1 putative DNA-binding transcriptional regulator AlpA [Rhizobium sp. BE258]
MTINLSPKEDASPLPGANRRYLTASSVRRRYDDISDMTLWRWIKDESVGFPAPIKIGQLRFFDIEKLEAFDAARGKAQ